MASATKHQHWEHGLARGRLRRGSLLLEVQVALFIIVLCLLPTIGVMIYSRKLNRQAQIQTVAYQAARQEMASLQAQAYANRNLVTSGTFAIPANLAGNFSTEIAMAGTYSIATYSAYTTPPVQQLTVEVTWKRMDTTASNVYSSVELSQLAAQEPGK